MNGEFVVTILVVLLTAILSGAGGYLAAVTRNGTRISLLEAQSVAHTRNWEECQGELRELARDNAHRLSMLLRLVIDIARKSGVELRTADVLEITSLAPGEKL